MLNTGMVANPATTNQPDGAPVNIMLGRQGEQIASEIHGKWYNAALRNCLFNASTAAAGTTIPISSATAATFGLINPMGSGVRMELVAYSSSVQNATTVVSSILLGLAGNLTVLPTGITKATVNGGMLGAANQPAGIAFTVATIAATTSFFEVGSYSATAGTFPSVYYFFDGQLSLLPGSLAHVCGTAAQTSASAQTLVWAEWPL